MDDPTDGSGEFDPLDESSRTLGRGLFEAEMGPSSSMAHLYRGEVHRMTRWRERLDRTTHWAVIVMAAILTWSFSNPESPHFVVLIGGVVVGFFLGLEAHRFRAYIVWRTRVRLIQENVWAYGLDPSGSLLHEDWRQELADDYREPTVKISYEEALAHRLRRIYLPMLGFVLVSWFVRTAVISPTSWPASAAVGVVPGWVVVATVLGLFALAAVVALRPRDWKGHPELRSRAIGEWKEE